MGYQSVPDMNVRQCVPTDRERCYAILKANMFEFFSRPGEWNDEKIYQEFWSPEIRVLERRGEIVGYLRVSRDREKMWLRDLHIAPCMQRQGIGKKVMRLLESEAVDNGCSTVALCVLKDNPARAFYAELGYSVAGEGEGDATRGEKPIFIMEKGLTDR